MIDDTFLILFNAWDGAIVFTLPAVSFGRRWTHELSTAEPELEAGSEVVSRRAVSSRSRAARSSCSAGSARWSSCAPTYRLQLGPGLGFAEARELVPYLRDLGVSHLYLSPVAPGALRLDARLRRRRSDADLGGSRRRGRVPRRSAPRRRARASCSTSSRTTWRRATRTPSGATRSGARSSSTSTGARASHRRFFDVGGLAGVRMEDPEVWEVDAREGGRARAGGSDRRRADRPSRRARESRAATSSGCARPGSSASGSRRSSSRASGCGRSGPSRARPATSS